MKAFQKGLVNPEVLNWPDNNDDLCGPPSWPYVLCCATRKLGLGGSFPENLNHLSKLIEVSLERNNFTRKFAPVEDKLAISWKCGLFLITFGTLLAVLLESGIKDSMQITAISWVYPNALIIMKAFKKILVNPKILN
ncbi:hypothetical protein ACFE04_027041 [Oxalis oulophora]